MLTKSCQQCGKTIVKLSNHSMKTWNEGVKYCSRACSKLNTCFGREGWEPWSKSQKGIHLSPNSEFKKGQMAREMNVNWKGVKVGRRALHSWVERTYGKTSCCEQCKLTKQPVGAKRDYFEWANVSGQYLRERSDWLRLCAACHRKMDNHLLPKGEQHHMAKLNVQKVKLIRMMQKDFKWDLVKISEILGKLYSVSPRTIKDILLRHTWEKVT